MSNDALTRATEVLRTISGDDSHRAAATRLRLRRELEDRAQGRRRLTSIGIVLGVLFGGTTAWALATDNASRMWSAIVASEPTTAPTTTTATKPPTTLPSPMEPVVLPAQHAVPREPTRLGSTADLAPVAAEPTSLTPAPAPAPVAQPASPRLTAPRPNLDPTTASATTPAPAKTPAPGDALYRRAHELHFRGTDSTAAIAAWDAYLAADPSGELALEARYNRALLLIRVGRYRDARAALLPFARGEVSTSSYRQDEAVELVDRLSRLNDSPASGHDAP